MSGVIAATTIAAVTAAAGVGSMIVGAKQGSKQNKLQEQSLQEQKTAQKQAERSAVSQQRKSEVAQNAANMKTPDISSILARASMSGAEGLSGTMLTGPAGVTPGTLNLGKSTLLGS